MLTAIEKENVKRSLIGKEPLRLIIYSIGYDYLYGKNSIDLTIPQYNDCITQSAKYYLRKTPYVIDSFVSLEKTTNKSYTTDDLHPNVKGVNAMAIDYITSLA